MRLGVQTCSGIRPCASLRSGVLDLAWLFKSIYVISSADRATYTSLQTADRGHRSCMVCLSALTASSDNLRGCGVLGLAVIFIYVS